MAGTSKGTTKPNAKGGGKNTQNKPQTAPPVAPTPPQPNPVGRPSKLTATVQAKIITAILAGNYISTACVYAGVDYTTHRKWMTKGERQKKGKYRDFFNAVTQAEAQCEVATVANWMNSVPKEWEAAQKFLVHRFPDKWGRRVVTQEGAMSVAVTGQVKSTVEHTAADELIGDPNFIAALQRAAEEGAGAGAARSVPRPVDGRQPE
jgi:hypothetical protein